MNIKKKSNWLWFKLTLIIGFSMLFLVILYMEIISLQVNKWCPKLEVKSYRAYTNFQYDLSYKYTKDEIKLLLEYYMKPGPYIYKEERLYCGATTDLHLRTIRVDNMTTKHLPFYTFALAHEFTHLKYYNGDECWTEFNAWKFLYECDNYYFHNVALWMANDITQDRKQNAYDCGYYIIEYLQEVKQ